MGSQQHNGKKKRNQANRGREEKENKTKQKHCFETVFNEEKAMYTEEAKNEIDSVSRQFNGLPGIR